MKYFGTFVVFMSFSAASCQFLNCDWVSSLDCSSYSPFPECGTDGITYDNRCLFAKQQCKSSDLHILHDGACLPSESVVTTTQRPNSGVDGEIAVLDFFCSSLSKIPCGDEDQPVCATDGWTYKNYCEYDKARCTHRDMHVSSFGACP